MKTLTNMALAAACVLIAASAVNDQGPGTVLSHQKISQTQGRFTGALDNDDRLDTRVAALGDHDGDGVEDIAVRAWTDDDGFWA